MRQQLSDGNRHRVGKRFGFGHGIQRRDCQQQWREH
jgi:hypothetical protein